MTINGGQPHAPTGDKGQRYEITFFNPNTQVREVLGWCTTLKGAETMRDGVYKHPTWHSPQIRDREAMA